MKAIELYVAEWRAKKNRASLTVIDIAKKAGLHFNTVYRIFNGKVKNVGSNTIIKIEAAIKSLERAKKIHRGENAFLTHPHGKSAGN